MSKELENCIDEIIPMMESIIADIKSYRDKKNNAAARRARTGTVHLAVKAKEFRRLSIEASKAEKSEKK